ncbi:nitrate reductase molybdenum cofactor assembly chaperone [Planctomonas sp. JC2975]|uniref:nitrate reductase molybdenum cofactor assembly chaperone n=1 Tax=Planctomonas sp. JC2975 TaxID=2729626 RepID=UPI0014765728|nr:nitrate reductase molybdenum cofactor assembly chaperone [Planctomonas sp. JC2975]NNC11988.1 nitrate reductase molybdenum cofactor assembly chaperone [Planctomonas sp. JC2975]
MAGVIRSGPPRERARVTPRRRLPARLDALSLTREQRQRVHLAGAVLLDYPDAAWFGKLATVRSLVAGLPAELRDPLDRFMDAALAASASRAEASTWEQHYVATFDLKRKCSLYLTYFATGDTRKRGTALVTILEAYRAAGWEFDADELPDYLPAVLEFSAVSDSEIAGALLSSHREGIEVLRAALEQMSSPWADVVRAVTLSLPPIDDATREHYLDLISEGPPTETVGLSFLGNLPPFEPHAQ